MQLHVFCYRIRMKDPAPATIVAWTALMRASTRMLTEIETALKAAGLPALTWYDALLEIEKAGDEGIRPLVLQERLLLPQYGTSRLLNRIEQSGYIVREDCAEDGRGQIVRLTPEGKEIRQRMRPVYMQALNRLLGDKLSGADAAHLAQLLDKLR